MSPVFTSPRRTSRALPTLLVWSLVSIAGAATAATRTVTVVDVDDVAVPGTLRYEVAQSDPGDTIDFALSLINPGGEPVEIVLKRPLAAFEDDLTIDGSMVGGVVVNVGFIDVPVDSEVCSGRDNAGTRPNFVLTVCDADLKLVDSFIGGFELAENQKASVLLDDTAGRLIYSTRNLDLNSPNFYFGKGRLMAAGPADLVLTGLSDFAKADPDDPEDAAGVTVVVGGRLVGDTGSLIGDLLICSTGSSDPECSTGTPPDPVDHEAAPGEDQPLLVFSHNNDQTFGDDEQVPNARTRGAGAMAKDGAGKLTFVGTMGHTGGTRIWEGTFEADADALGGSIHICSLAGGDSTDDCEPNTNAAGDDLTPIDDPTNNPPAKLVINQGDDGTLASSVTFSGFGAIEKVGSGTLTMNASNDMSNFEGPFSVNVGGLNLVSATVDAGSFTMAAGTSLRGSNDALVQADTVSFLGASLTDGGGAGLRIAAESTITFQGSNTLAGSSINLGAPSIRVLSGGRLTGNGFGLTLSTPLDVRGGAIFGGSGTVLGDVLVSGTLELTELAAYAGSATLEVDDVDFAAGSRFSTILDPDSDEATRLGGDIVSFDDASTIEVEFRGGSDAPVASDKRYRIVDAGAALNIDLGEIELQSEGKAVAQTLTLELATSGCSGVECLDLLLTVGDVPLTAIAETPNQNIIAGQLDAAGALVCGKTGPPGNEVYACDPASDIGTVYFDLQFRTPEADVPFVLDQMAGAGLAAFTDVRLAANTRYARSISRRFDLETRVSDANGMALLRGTRSAPNSSFAILGQSALPRVSAEGAPTLPQRGGMGRHPGKGGWTSWGDLHGVFASIDGEYDADDTDYRIYGPILGVDYGITDIITVGGTFGYQRGEFQTNDDFTKGTSNTYSVGAYAGALGKHGYVTAAVRYAYSQMLTRRHMEFAQLAATPQSRIAHGDFDGQEIALFAEGAWGFDVGRGITIQPVASLVYDHLEQDGFEEDDAADLNLAVDEFKTDVVETFIGVRTGFLGITEGTTYVHPQIRVGWERSWTGRGRTLDMELPGAAGTGSFTVDGTQFPKDRAVVGISTETGLNETFNLFLEYDARIASGWLENTVALGFRVTW